MRIASWSPPILGRMDGWEPLLDRARAGEDLAWRSILGIVAGPVLGLSRARGSSDPEDVLAAVLLDLVRALPRFHGDPQALRAFALKIARDRIADQHRRGSARHERIDRQALEIADPADHAERASEDDRVRRALATLPPLQREVIYLRLGLGLSADEVGAIVGKRAGAIRVLVHRAVLRLRAEQATWDDPNGGDPPPRPRAL